MRRTLLCLLAIFGVVFPPLLQCSLEPMNGSWGKENNGGSKILWGWAQNGEAARLEGLDSEAVNTESMEVALSHQSVSAVNTPSGVRPKAQLPEGFLYSTYSATIIIIIIIGTLNHFYGEVVADPATA